MYNKFDVIIIGAGINGCAAARSLSLKGKKVIILEKNCIASGTSSNSSKLIHGGLRYLENMQFSLVRESLIDRKRLGELYPDLISMVPFYLPVYEDSPRPWWIVRIGLGLYDFLSGQKEYACKRAAIRDFTRLFPKIKNDGLQRVYVYYDGKTDDRELTRRIAQDAVAAGCRIIEKCDIKQITTLDDGFSVSFNTESFTDNTIHAPVLINASGPWIDEVNDHYNLPHNFRIEKISGIHIVTKQQLVPDCMFLQTREKRIFFMIPWENNHTIIGTTERPESCHCDDVKINNADIDYLLNYSNHYLHDPITHDDICDTFLGIRPLVKGKHTGDATAMSRDYKIDIITHGKAKLIHVYGGKLTTCLSMADRVVKACK